MFEPLIRIPYDTCDNCGGPIQDPFGNRRSWDDLTRTVTMGVVFVVPSCDHCEDDFAALSGTPGIQIVTTLRERFQNEEFTYREFVRLEIEQLGQLLNVTDVEELPKEVEQEILNHQNKLAADTDWTLTSQFQLTSSFGKNFKIPAEQLLANWDPHTGLVQLPISIKDIALAFTYENSPGPLTRMWLRYCDLSSKTHLLDTSWNFEASDLDLSDGE